MVGEGMSLPLWRFLRALVATNLRSALALRGSFWLSMLFMVLNNLAFDWVNKHADIDNFVDVNNRA